MKERVVWILVLQPWTSCKFYSLTESVGWAGLVISFVEKGGMEETVIILSPCLEQSYWACALSQWTDLGSQLSQIWIIGVWANDLTSWRASSLSKSLLRVAPGNPTYSVWSFNPGNPAHGEWPLNTTPHPAFSTSWKKTQVTEIPSKFSISFFFSHCSQEQHCLLLLLPFLCEAERSLVNPTWLCISHPSENWQRSSKLHLKLLKDIHYIHTNLLGQRRSW